MLARHRDDRACAGCHRRFDSVGLIFEGYGPIGERRDKDLGGKPVQNAGNFPDGKDRTGLAGLRDYLHDRRENDFIENFCRKLLAYALGRSLQPSDRATIQEMRKVDRLTIGGLIDIIVTSPQFLNKRGGLEQR